MSLFSKLSGNIVGFPSWPKAQEERHKLLDIVEEAQRDAILYICTIAAHNALFKADPGKKQEGSKKALKGIQDRISLAVYSDSSSSSNSSRSGSSIVIVGGIAIVGST